MDNVTLLEIINDVARAKGRKLELVEKDIKELPKEIEKLTYLEELDLRQNKLTTIPKEIERLSNLRVLNLGGNRISIVPRELWKLSNLMRLDLWDNGIYDLSPEIVQLTKLETFNISDNALTYLPDILWLLRNLKHLDIRANQITAIPPGIANLKKLLTLNAGNNRVIIDKRREITASKGLGNNRIEALPEDFEELTSLEKLDLFSVNLNRLPKRFNRLRNLQQLDLRDNPIPIPSEILEKYNEPQTILNYYFSVFKVAVADNITIEMQIKSAVLTTSKRLNEIKLLIVGQGSVGKTSLVQQILHGTFDQNQTKTEGISINQWQVNGNWESEKGNRGKSEVNKSDSQGSNPESLIRLNIWDFGGQEIMHATHQFFLTKRSLYLLVLDARLTQEENRVEYWLKIIQSFGGESPVLIVGNKTDQHPLDIDRTGLQKKYPNIVGILETSAATGMGIAALKAEIAKQVDTLPHVRDLLPETWFTVKSKLEKLGRDKNFITQDEYLSLCGANDVTDETSQHTLIGFLHDLGVVLHFQDDPRLEALGILNPQWVTNGVYKILNSHELFQNQGTLTLPILNKTLIPPEYPSNKRLFIVDMMKKFELCYDIEPDKSFLIPDLLPKDEPFTGEWDGALAFQYHYNVLPTSIISRFIVRMNPFVHKTVWRSGVVLKSGGNTALVKADTEDRKIFIWVLGEVPTRRDFLSAIRMEFDAIHKTIAKIEATEKVPLPNYPKADPVDHAFLLQLERDSRDSFPVSIEGKIVDINVRELLNGIRPSKNQAAKVFISYSHQDKSFIKKLAGELEGQGMKVWWDFDSLKGGQDWQKEIERGIKQCDFFLVALTPDAVNSEWVGNEILYASNAQKTIIPLHLKKCDIPIGLIKKQWVDFQNQTQKAAIKELLGILILNSQGSSS